MSNTNVYGFFDYAPISTEVARLRKEVEDLDDDSLVEVVADLRFYISTIDELVSEYLWSRNPLTPEQREKLIGFYILDQIDEDIEV